MPKFDKEIETLESEGDKLEKVEIVLERIEKELVNLPETKWLVIVIAAVVAFGGLFGFSLAVIKLYLSDPTGAGQMPSARGAIGLLFFLFPVALGFRYFFKGILTARQRKLLSAAKENLQKAKERLSR